ncbi:MAG: hypothetical protein K6C97_02290 [Treponema sp.]|nr:hypothetical protein [Treponema sp.]
MKLKKITYFSIIFALIFLLFSCATTVNVRMTRPAKLDLQGAKTISVLPFKPSSSYSSLTESDNAVLFVIGTFFQIFDYNNPYEEKLLTYLKSSIEEGLASSQYIDLVSSVSVQNALKNNKRAPVDVYLVGATSDFYVNDSHDVEKKKITDEYYNEDGRLIKAKYEYKDKYKRTARLSFNYQLVDASTGKVIAYRNFSIDNTSGSYSSKSELPNPYDMLKYKISYKAEDILKELQPYVITKSIRLLEDKSKNEAFKYANELAKKGYIDESYQAFYNLYFATGMMEAGYNAAMLDMARGNLSMAEKMMKELLSIYQDERILIGLSDIQNEINLANQLHSQTGY